MSEEKARDLYFQWICDFVNDDRYYSKGLSHQKLLSFLFNKEFIYILPMDINRAKDGTALRDRFIYEKGLSGDRSFSFIFEFPCSVLEMMVALSIRVEANLMSDSKYGNRVGQWFWGMIVNLGLGHMTDDYFDQNEANKSVNRFLNRRYERNGKGGLVRVYNTNVDMRKIEIWYQMMQYLREYIEVS